MINISERIISKYNLHNRSKKVKKFIHDWWGWKDDEKDKEAMLMTDYFFQTYKDYENFIPELNSEPIGNTLSNICTSIEITKMKELYNIIHNDKYEEKVKKDIEMLRGK